MKNNRKKHFAVQLTNLPSFASYMLLPRQKKFFLPSLCSGFTRPSLTKGTEMYTGGIKRGVAEARRLSGQRPHAPGLSAAPEKSLPSTPPPLRSGVASEFSDLLQSTRTLARHWALSETFSAQERQGVKKENGENE